jgi:hypothetical protein
LDATGALLITKRERDDGELHATKSMNPKDGSLTGTLKILDAASDVTIRVILPSRSVQYSISVAAPTEGRQLTRVSWLTRYLDAEKLPSGDLQASVDWTVRGLTTTASLHDYLADAGILCVDKGGIPIPKNANPRYFQIAMTRSLSNARGKSGSPVLTDISKGLEEFYRKVLQDNALYHMRQRRRDSPSKSQKQSQKQSASQFRWGHSRRKESSLRKRSRRARPRSARCRIRLTRRAKISIVERPTAAC